MTKFNPYFSLSLPRWLLFFVLASITFKTSNPQLTMASVVALPIFASLLWVRGEPPILFFVVAFQWLEVTAKVFHADALGIRVEEMFGGAEIERAIGLGLTGLVMIALGMRMAMSRLKIFEAVKMQGEVTQLSVDRLWAGYLFASAASVGFKILARGFLSAKEQLLAFSSLKWVMFFVLAYTVLRRREKRVYLILATLIEVAAGFTGFFSTFKYVFYVLILVFLAVGYRLTWQNIIRVVSTVLLVVLLSSVWISIREEYRDYMNIGTGEQKVMVTLGARVSKLFELLGQTNSESLRKGFESLTLRVAYVDMFAHVLRMVPSAIPYEGGRLWEKAIKHIMTPRLFFPDKPGLPSDTESTMKYTGLWLIVPGQDTSVSMGYMAESYIDFGIPGMFVPIFLLGLLWGAMYRYLTTSAKVKIFGYAIAMTVLIDTLNFGSNNVKLLGGVVTNFIAMAVVSKFFIPGIYRWLSLRRTLLQS